MTARTTAGSHTAAMRTRVRNEGLVAIVRGGYSLPEIIAIADAMLAAPLPLLEITMNTPDALTAIQTLRQRYDDSMAIGAGTVRTADQAAAAIEAGAEFLVSPCLDPASVRVAVEADVLFLPGIFTPTEAQQAFQLDCTMVKLFPCPNPAYLKAVKAPLSDMEFVPTGGIDADNIGSYRQAGAAGVGIGSSLVGSDIRQDVLITKARLLLHNWQAAT